MRYHTKRPFMFGGRQYGPGDIVDADVPESIAEAVGLVPLDGEAAAAPTTRTVWKGERAKRCYSDAPLISVIITFHNQKEYVDECLRSFEAQTTGMPYEIIAVDDASDDGLAEHMSQHYPKVRYVRIEARNANAARNAGFKQASGKYICWFDGDDWAYPEYLEKLHEALLANPGAGVSYARFHYEPCGLDKGVLPACNTFEWDDKLVDYQAIINTPSMVERRIAEQLEWDEKLKCNQDYEINFQMRKAGAKPFHVREELFHYRVNDKSVWGSGEGGKLRKDAREYIRRKWGVKLKEAECTLVSLISRPDTLDEYLEGLKKIKMPRGKMHWFVFVDSDDIRLIKKVKEKAVDGRFLTTRMFITNEKNLEASCDFTARAMRIARNVKVMVNEANRTSAQTKYVFMVEDDTIAPPDAYARLRRLASMPKVAMATGVECSRVRSRHMGVGWLNKDESGEIVERVTPFSKSKGVEDVNASGWYCWVGRVDIIRKMCLRCVEDGRYLGPDVLMAHDLTAAGHRVMVDWEVQCEHWDPIIEKWVHPSEGQGYRFEFVKRGNVWETITHKLMK